MPPAGFKYLSHDPMSKIWTWFRFDEATGDISTCTTHYHDEIIEDNKREQYDARGKMTRKGRWGAKAASIPIGLIHKWQVEEGWSVYDAGRCEMAAKKLKQKLNSSEYAYLRVAQFRM